jgi:hypothetical protein
MYIVERVLILIALNVSIMANNYFLPLILVGVCVAGIFAIKIYYSMITIK